MSDEEPRFDLARNLLPPLRPTGGPVHGGGSLARTPGFAPPEPNNTPPAISA